MANLEELKQKYASVISLFEKLAPYGAKLDVVELEGDKLHLKGEVPSTVVANHVWDLIKKADPTYSDLHHEIATTGGEEQEYTESSMTDLRTEERTALAETPILLRAQIGSRRYKAEIPVSDVFPTGAAARS